MGLVWARCKRMLRPITMSRAGIRMAAWACRHRPATLGSARLSWALYLRMWKVGTERATFGRGRTVVCDLSVGYDRHVFAGHEEATERRLLDLLLRPGDVFVDAGANIGLLTVFGAAAVGPQGRVYAFEPVPSTFARLCQSVDASGVTAQVRLAELALSDTDDARVTLTGDAHNAMRIGGGAGRSTQVARTITLDRALGDTPRVAGIKIDVEGHELAVLRGAEAIIRRDAPWIIVEFNTELAGVGALRDWEVHRHLTERGYRAHLPYAVVQWGNLSPLPAHWETPLHYVNLVYWRGAAPGPLGAATRAHRESFSVRAARNVLRLRGREGAYLLVASTLARIDRARRGLWRVRHRRSVAPEQLSAPPTAVAAAIAHWRGGGAAAERFGYLAQVVDGLLAIDAPRVTVAVISNDAVATLRDLREHLSSDEGTVHLRVADDPRSALRAPVGPREVVVVHWRPGLVRRHGFYLTWAHVPVLRGAMASRQYSHLIYLEDDELFTNEHLDYWCAYRAPLAAHGLLPGFLRFERHDGARYAVDQKARIDPTLRRRRTAPTHDGLCHDFVNLDVPYQGLYVLDEPLAEPHFRFSPWRSPLRSRIHHWEIRERATAGPNLDDVPKGLLSRNVVPVCIESGTVRPHPACLIEHLAANYGMERRSPIPIDDLFVEDAP